MLSRVRYCRCYSFKPQKISLTVLLFVSGLNFISPGRAYAESGKADSLDGYYIGAAIGGNALSGGFAPFSGTFSTTHATGEIRAGLNYQFTNGVVLGLETSFGSILAGGWQACPQYRAVQCGLRDFWSDTYATRLGYSIGNILPYVKAGVSLTDPEARVLISGPYGGTYHTRNIVDSYLFGGGVEYRIGNSLSSYVEYKHSSVGQFYSPFYTLVNAKNVSVIVGISYHLDAPWYSHLPAIDGDGSSPGVLVVNLTEENDSFLNTSDKHYTQGLRLSVAPKSDRGCLLNEIANAAFLSNLNCDSLGPDIGNRHSFSFGQTIFTPTDLSLVHPDIKDRPYAGWLFGSYDIYRETTVSANRSTLDRAEITLGLVGPGADGRLIQTSWHKYLQLVFGGALVKGWGAQLHNEPGLVLTEEKKWRFQTISGGWLDSDVVPEATVSLGNIFTYGAAGGLLRIGKHLDADWGPPRIQPAISGSDFVDYDKLGDWFSWYFFAGGEGRLIGRNIFLDGNSFENSASVNRKLLVKDFTAGIAFVAPFVRGNVSYVRRTKEFVSQITNDEFISVNLGFLF